MVKEASRTAIWLHKPRCPPFLKSWRRFSHGTRRQRFRVTSGQPTGNRERLGLALRRTGRRPEPSLGDPTSILFIEATGI
jgi:hypothetical protein